MPSLFERVVFGEADEEAPDISDPNLPEEAATGPPATDEMDAPPDVSAPDFGAGTEDPLATNTGMEEEREEPLRVSEKISLAMNASLYQRFLTLLNTVNNQISTIKGNNDVIYSISPTSLETMEPLTKLSENLSMYLANNFLDCNYSKNRLFYNKCVNLLKLLDDQFTKELRKQKPQEE